MERRAFIAALALLAAFGSALAEERLGVTVYPGAKYDADASKAVKDMVKDTLVSFVGMKQ